MAEPRPEPASRRAGGRVSFASLSASSLRWWAGGFCAFLGAFMLVVPGEFDAPAYVALAGRVPEWGLGFLVAGWAMLAVAALRPRQTLHAAAHALVVAIFVLLAGSFTVSGAWSGTLVYGVLALVVVVSGLLPAHQRLPAGARSGDLLALGFGAASLLVGGSLFVVPVPGVDALDGAARARLGALLAASGALLAAVQVAPRLRRGWGLAAHVAAGFVLLTTAAVLTLPIHAWTGVALYGSGGSLVALLPWLRQRLRDFDPASLATRLSLLLAAAASLPMVLTLGVVERAGMATGDDASRLRAFMLLLVTVAAAVGFAIVTARSLAWPLRRLGEAADRLAAGEPAVPLDRVEVSEVDRLSANFRHMRDRLAERERRAEELTAELRQRADELAEADRRKDEFVAMLAHELRNPLGAVANAACLLEEAPADPEITVRAAAVVRRQMRLFGRLVDDLLDVSRITRGQVPLHREPLDLGEVLRRGAELARPQLDAAGLDLVVEIPAEPLPVDADATRLDQVFSNLLGNAVKYTETGGRVSLVAARADGEAVVRVRDDGVGIPSEVQPLVFDLFFQGESGLDRRDGGLGIGLTLVRQLVELHGGRVTVASEGRGQGSEFVVHLPLAG